MLYMELCISWLLTLSIKFNILFCWLFKWGVLMFPDKLFYIISDMVSLVGKKREYNIIDAIIVTFPHRMNILGSFKLYLMFDNQRNGLLNIEKCCKLYSKILYEHRILMISYNHNKKLKYRFINLNTKKIMDNGREYTPDYNVCPL